MRKLGLRAKVICPKPHGPGMAMMCALAPGHSLAAPSLRVLVRTAAAIYMTPHIIPTIGTNWLDPQTPRYNIPSTRSSPLLLRKPPATPSCAFSAIFCFFCSTESPGEGLPQPPYQVQQHSQSIPCALRVLQDLGEGLADERGGAVQLNIIPNEHEPCEEHRRAPQSLPSPQSAAGRPQLPPTRSPGWSLQLTNASQLPSRREGPVQDSCSRGWTVGA